MREELAGLGIALRRVSLWGVGIFYLFVGLVVWRLGAGHDSFAYWWAWHHHPMYGIAPRHFGAFLYSPVFAQAIWPLTRLPWPVFFWIWTVGSFAIYGWLLWPLRWWIRIPLLCLCVPQVIQGNVWPIFALVLVFGFRRPALWSIPLLVKVTSAMGLVWFAVRREWRALAQALVAAAALVGVSALISPHLWTAWIHLLIYGGSASTPEFTGGAPNIPLAVRLPIAIALTVYGARKERVAFLAFAVCLASPVFDTGLTLSNFFVLAAIPRMRAMRPTVEGQARGSTAEAQSATHTRVQPAGYQ
jgi:hypothetical protein